MTVHTHGKAQHMSDINVAVVGLGVFGQLHARTLSAMPGARLVGLYDQNTELTGHTATELGVTACRSVRDLIELDGLDAITVCTSDDQHVEVALDALKEGLHVLVEKPLATTSAEAARLVAAAESAPELVAAVGHILRHEPRYRAAKQAVASGQIGEVVHTYARRYNTVAVGDRVRGRTSVTMFLGVHDLDALMWITGHRIRTVTAFGSRTGPTTWGEADTVVAALEYEPGSVGVTESSWALPETSPSGIDAQLQIIGTTGRIEIAIHDQGLRLLTDALSFPDPGEITPEPATSLLAVELGAFLSSIRDGRPPTTSFADGFAAVAVAEAIDTSRQRGGEPVQVHYGRP